MGDDKTGLSNGGSLAVPGGERDPETIVLSRFPTVTVILPVYNDQQGAERCLRALCRQAWPMSRLQVVVVDNVSDPPLRIEEKLPFSLRVITCLTPGSYAARNAGVELATGDVIAFTDADCVPECHWLEKSVGALVDGGGKIIVSGDVVMSLPAQPTAVALYQWATGFQQKENVQQRGFGVTANLACFKSEFNQVGPFDEKFLSGGDTEWCWRALARGYQLNYVADAVVCTSPRTSVRAAIRQARRVAAGRLALRKHNLTQGGVAGLERHRDLLAAVRWLFSTDKILCRDRPRVLGVAALIKLFSWIEVLRIRAGGNAERR